MPPIHHSEAQRKAESPDKAEQVQQNLGLVGGRVAKTAQRA
jgi:hypothetical protein